MPPLPRILVDTNVLFPFSVMDLMLAPTEDGIHTILWTDALLDEWERVIVRSGRRSVSSAAVVTAAVRKFFPDSEVPLGSYTGLVADMPGKDPDDRLHMAAAVAGCATHIVTYNLSDFPAARLAEYGVTVTDPDTYLCGLFGEFGDEGHLDRRPARRGETQSADERGRPSGPPRPGRRGPVRRARAPCGVGGITDSDSSADGRTG